MGLASLFSFLAMGGNIYPWRHPIIISSGTSFLVFLGLLIRVESKATRPVMPLAVFHKFPMRNLILTAFFFAIINYMVSLCRQTLELESKLV